MLSSPVFLLGMTLATLVAALFHLFRGQGVRQGILYWFSGVVGFFLGQLVGSIFFSSWPTLGQISIIPAFVICVGALFIVSSLRLC